MAKIISFISGKGGSGKSTVVVGIGNALARQGKKVLIVDTDTGLNSLDTMTGVGEGAVYNWGDVFSDTCSVEDAIYPSLDINGLFVLPAPKDYRKSFNVNILSDLLRLISHNFDFILIDAPAGLGKGLKLSLMPAEESILVSTDDTVSLKSARKAAEISESLGKPSSLILNAFRTYPVLNGILPNVDEAMDSTELPLLGIIPFEANLNYNASRGIPFTENTRATNAFARIAKRISGEKVDLPEEWR